MKNFGAALACSAVGTLMSLLGMIVLLFYKGDSPWSSSLIERS